MKKKGEFKEAQHRHRKQQAVYDALKRCRDEGGAWVTFKGERLYLRRLEAGEQPGTAMVKYRGRVRLADLVWKDGLTACFDVGSADLQSKDVLCAVLPPSAAPKPDPLLALARSLS